jgi:hypothetical protein
MGRYVVAVQIADGTRALSFSRANDADFRVMNLMRIGLKPTRLGVCVSWLVDSCTPIGGFLH